MKTRFSACWSKRLVGPAETPVVRIARSGGDEGRFGFREFVRLCTRSALTGAVLASSVAPNARACTEWEYHVNRTSSQRNADGCLEEFFESWNERGINCGSAGCTGVEYSGNQTWSEVSDCPPPGGGDEGGGGGGGEGTDPDGCEGANPFNPADGNVTREVADLKVPGAASGRLHLIRHHNSVPSEGVHYFGVGGNWRHSWQYDLTALPVPAGARAQMVLVYPTGRQRIFEQKADGQWAAAERFREKIAITDNGFEVKTAEGASLKFVRSTVPNAPHTYEMRAFTDTYGAVTALDYGSDGWLKRVTEPAGRWLAFDYKDTTHKKGLWRQLGAVVQAPASGQWIELTVPAAWNRQTFQHLRLRGAKDSAPVVIAEVQFIAAGSADILRGQATGTGDKPAALFDGDTATIFKGLRASANVCGLDLGADRKSAVSKVRILAAAGKETTLVGAVVEGLEIVASVRPAISKATGSDGRSVTYDYTVLADPVTRHEFLALTGVSYGDGTKAVYRYEWPRANSRPLLVETDDPRYEGRAKRIRYAYHDQLGVIHQEINPASGAVYASLEFDPKDPQARIVRYSDLREVKYKIAADRPAVLERTDSLGRNQRTEHDAVGRIRAIVDRKGVREEYTYNTKGRVASVKRNQRIEKQRDRDANDRITRDVDRQGRETRYERDGKGRVTRMTLGSGEARDYEYDSLGRITAFRSKSGGLHRFSFNERGLKETWTNPAGGITRYAYNANDQLVAITDPIGRIARSERNERGLLTKVTAPDGTIQQFAYDSYGRKVAETDPHGRTTKFTYDELSRVIRQEDHAGRVTLFDYTEIPQGCSSCTLTPHPSRIIAPDGTVTAMLYDTEGQLLSRTVAQGTAAQATTLFSYDNDGNMTSMTDPLGRVTRYTYDDEHHRLTQTDALGRVTKWTYDDDGSVIKTVAPDGGVSTATFDNAKRLTSTTDAAGNTARYDYDANGRLVATTNAAREITRFTYDAAGRKIATIYADGKKALIDYDTANRPAKTTSPDGLVTTTTYDAGNRPLTVTRAAPGKSAETNTFTYDALGHRLTATDPLGRKTAWTYDARGNVLTVTRPDGVVGTRNTYDGHDNLLTGTDAAGAITTYTYDAARNQTSLTDARGSRYAFTYDALRRKTSMTYPDSSVEKWAYDLAGNPVAFTNRAGQTKATAYTAANQPLTETWSPAASPLAPSLTPTLPAPTAYAYGANGRLKQVDNGNATLTYAYDDLGRPASETSDLSSLVPGLATHTVGYRYDALGRRSDLVYPDRTKVSYDYDARSRLMTIDPQGGGRTPLATYAYDAQGRIEKLTRDNGVVSTYSYDMAGQLTDITHKNGGTVLARSAYTLDVLGRRTAQTREDGITETYGYDTTSQLTSANYGSNSPLAKAASPVTRENFTYDVLGNRTQVGRVVPNAPSTTTAYTANALNQYTQVAGVAFAYDANGNLTNDGKQVYRYDAQNRLITVETLPVAGALRPDSVKAEFAYDARNRAVLRKYYSLNTAGAWVLNAADSRALTYDTAWNLLAERKPDGAQVGEYTHGQRIDEVLVSNLQSQVVYPLADGLGSVVALTADNGKVIERFRYSAYGQPMNLSVAYQGPATSVSEYRLLFTGREWLGSLGLYEHRNRYQIALLGRWLVTDPIGFEGGNNLYKYVNNGPIVFSDYRGLDNPGCDLWLGGPAGDCYKRCCAAHDSCYYANGCTATSWSYSICPGIFNSCAGCNQSALGCFAACAAGIDAGGPKYFCPNGPSAGSYYNDEVDMPASCWSDGVHPLGLG